MLYCGTFVEYGGIMKTKVTNDGYIYVKDSSTRKVEVFKDDEEGRVQADKCLNKKMKEEVSWFESVMRQLEES